MSKSFDYDEYYDAEYLSEFEEESSTDPDDDYIIEDVEDEEDLYAGEEKNSDDLSDASVEEKNNKYTELSDDTSAETEKKRKAETAEKIKKDDSEEDEFYGDESYENFKKNKAGQKNDIQASKRGEDVQKRFFKIMEDYHSGDFKRRQAAMEQAIEELKGFIFHIIRKSYSTYTRNYYYDLVQEGKLGIIEGLKKYDPSKSMPTTFFSPYIKHEIQSFITSQVDKTTSHYSSNIKKINKVIARFEAEEKPYTNVDIAIQTGLSPETVAKSMEIRTSREEVHIDGCVPGVLEGFQKDTYVPTPEEDYIKKEEKNILYDAISDNLTDEEIQVLTMHFGLYDTEKLSEGEISKRLHIPKDKVKRLLNSSIRKLKDSNLKTIYKNHLAHEQDLIEETEISIIPSVTLDMQMDILEDLYDDDNND